MKTLWRIFSAITLLVAFSSLCPQLMAQETEFTYQGRVTDNGTNFNGIGQFEFSFYTVTNTSSQATAVGSSVDFDGGGLNGITVTYPGNGYLTPPAVTITSPIGSGAAATAVLTGESVSAVNITAQGTGYGSTGGANNAIVTIAPPPAFYTNLTLWSNDGTTNGEPAAAVKIPVVNGLFTVVMGDPTISNMTAIPAALFSQYAYPNIWLQIWFNDGVHGFSALSPGQPLTAVPSAVFAQNAGVASTASNLLGTLPTAQLTGSVPATSLTGAIPTANLGITNSYTPTIGDGTHNFSMSNQRGYYWQIGNIVYFEAWVTWNSKGSAVSGDNVVISLPSTTVSTRVAFTLGFVSGVTFANGLDAGSYNGQSYAYLYNITSGGTGAFVTVNGCASSGEVQISGSYRVQ